MTDSRRFLNTRTALAALAGAVFGLFLAGSASIHAISFDPTEGGGYEP